LPDGLKLDVAFNTPTYVGAAIEEVYKSLIIAFISLVLSIYLFLGKP
jgi:Cation/multidrug efflux pump